MSAREEGEEMSKEETSKEDYNDLGSSSDSYLSDWDSDGPTGNTGNRDERDRGNSNLDLLLKEVSYKNELHLEEVKQNLSRILQHVSFNDFHIASCICGCGVKDTFWQCIEYGSIRLDILKYLFESKLIDLDNHDQRQKILKVFSQVLSNSGVSNTEGMTDRIHNITLFLFEIFLPYPDAVKSFSGSYKESLVHSAFYGHHHERKEQYVLMLLNIGCVPGLTQINADDDSCGFEITQKFSANGEQVGQSVIYLASCGDHQHILQRLVAEESPIRDQLNSYQYSCQTQIDQKVFSERYVFVPIVMNMLMHFSKAKKAEWMESTAKDIEMLIKAGYDLSLTASYYDVRGTCILKHNITDFLNHYKYIYPGSPIMKLFADLGIKLPAPLDRNEMFFWDDGPSRYDDEFAKVLRKHQYTKDPAMFQGIIDELRETEKSCHSPSFYSSWWTAVPIFDEYSKQLK